MGALALLLLSKIGTRARPKRVPRPQSAAPDHAFDQLATPLALQPLRPPRVPDKYYLWMNLSSREKEVAYLVAQDKTNGEIAVELRISHYTVANHLRHIYSKLEINSRQQLTRVVRQVVDYERDTPI